MASKSKIGASIVLDGEKEFKQAVTDCNRKLTALRSELTNVKEKYAENANSLTALQEKDKALNNILDQQKQKTERTAEALEHAKSVRDKITNSVETLNNKYNEENNKLEEMKRSTNASNDEIEKQQKYVNELASAISKGNENYQKAENRVVIWTGKLSAAEAQETKAGRAVRENSRYLEEAKTSYDHCATSIDNYGKKANNAGVQSREAFQKFASAIVASGIQQKVEDIARALNECADAADEFESSSAKVSTIADTSKESMSELNNQMMDLSTKTGKSVSDIAESTYQAISAGQDTTNAVSTVGEATKLAAGGFTEAETAIDGLTTIMNSYGDKLSNVSDVSDFFITVQNKGKTTVDELAQNIGKVATNAANYNVSLQDLGASYIQLTKRGVETSEATTYIKSLLKELAKNGSDSAKILKNQTGKSFVELMKDGESLGDVIQILSDSVGGDTEAFSNLFSRQEAGTAATVLLKTGTEEYNQTLQEVKDSAGATEQAYQKMTDTSEHSKEVMVNGIENLKIAIGQELNVALEGLYKVGGNATEWAQRMIKENPALVRGITAVTVALGVGTTALTSYTVATQVIIPLIKEMWVVLAANPYAMVATLIGTVVAGLVTYSAMQEKAMTATEKEAEAEKKQISALKEKHEELQNSISQTKDTILNSKAETTTVSNLVDRLKKLNSVQHKTAAQKLEIKTIAEELREKIPQVAKAYDEESGSIKLTNNQLDKLVNNYKRAALAAAAQTQMKDAAKQELEAEVNLQKAEIKHTEWTEKRTKAEKELNKAKEEYRKKFTNGAGYMEDNPNTKESKALATAQKNYNAASNAVKKYKTQVNNFKNDQKNANSAIEQAQQFIEKYSNSTKKSAESGKKSAAQYKQITKSFQSAKTGLAAYGKKVDSSTQKAFDNAVKMAKKTGTNIPKGLASGLKSGSKSPQTAVTEINTAIQKKLLVISKTANKQGVYITEELTNGLTSGTANVNEAYDELDKGITAKAKEIESKLSDNGVAVSKKTQKDIEAGGTTALSAMKRMESQLKAQASAGSTSIANSAKAPLDNLASQTPSSGANSVQGLINGARSKQALLNMTFKDLADSAVAAYNNAMVIRSPSRRMKKSGVHTVDGLIQGILSKKSNLKKSAGELAEILNSKLSTKIEIKDLQKNGHGYSQATIIKFWNGAVKATKKGTSAHTDALKNYYEARNELYEKWKEKQKKIQSDYKETLKDTKAKIKEAQKTYKDAVSDTASTIKSSFSLFEKAQVTKTNNASGLIRNMKTQADTVEQWKKNMDKLRKRGISSSLLKDLEEAGVSSAGDVSTLASMTDAQLKQYQKYYKKRNSTANAEAKKENASLKKSTEAKIKTYESNAKKEIKALEKQYKALQKKQKQLSKTTQKEMKSLGLNLSKGFAKGIESGSKDIYKAIAKMTGQTVKKTKKNLGIHSPSTVFAKIGHFTGLGFAQGLQKESEKLSDILVKGLPKSVDAPTVTSGVVNTGTISNPNSSTAVLNLYMNSDIIASGTFKQIDLMQGANIRLMKRGLSR